MGRTTTPRSRFTRPATTNLTPELAARMERKLERTSESESAYIRRLISKDLAKED